MKCIKCNGLVDKDGFCTECFVNQKYYRKAYSISNICYNNGLEKAKMRNLSGAILDLKASLKYNKSQIDARNLLGLIYYEMGNITEALREWNISLSMIPNSNVAGEYKKELLSSVTRIEKYNQAIKKYNQALMYAKQKSYDLALIQIKRIISANPNFIDANLLASLLYIKEGETEKAREILTSVLQIDVNNEKAMYYLNEIGGKKSLSKNKKVSIAYEDLESEETSVEMENRPKKQFKKEIDINVPINLRPITEFEEPRTGLKNFLYMFVGLIIGVAVMYILVVPQKIKDTQSDYSSMKTNYESQLVLKEQQITTLESNQTNIQEENKTLKKKIKKYKEKAEIVNIYDDFFVASKEYINGERNLAAEKLKEIDVDSFTSQNAIDFYNAMTESMFAELSVKYYTEGYFVYDSGNYQEAVSLLEKAYGYDSDNDKIIYFYARANQFSGLDGSIQKARDLFNILVENFPDSSYAEKAKEILSWL